MESTINLHVGPVLKVGCTYNLFVKFNFAKFQVPDNSKYARQPSGQSTPQSAPAILSMPPMASSEASPMPTPPPSASTPGCSAKKRWLRAAMCEDSLEDQVTKNCSTHGRSLIWPRG